MADLKRHEELVVITKTYDLILWSCNHTGKFPRNHRFVLGERIERNLYDLLETIDEIGKLVGGWVRRVAAFARTRGPQPAFWRTRLHAHAQHDQGSSGAA